MESIYIISKKENEWKHGWCVWCGPAFGENLAKVQQRSPLPGGNWTPKSCSNVQTWLISRKRWDVLGFDLCCVAICVKVGLPCVLFGLTFVLLMAWKGGCWAVGLPRVFLWKRLPKSQVGKDRNLPTIHEIQAWKVGLSQHIGSTHPW